MTIQNLFVAELADILRVQLECKCGARLSYEPDKKITLPHECPQCHEHWRDPIKETLDEKIVKAFMETLKNIKEQQQVNGFLKIQLVFDRSAVDAE